MVLKKNFGRFEEKKYDFDHIVSYKILRGEICYSVQVMFNGRSYYFSLCFTLKMWIFYF